MGEESVTPSGLSIPRVVSGAAFGLGDAIGSLFVIDQHTVVSPLPGEGIRVGLGRCGLDLGLILSIQIVAVTLRIFFFFLPNTADEAVATLTHVDLTGETAVVVAQVFRAPWALHSCEMRWLVG